MDCTYKCDTEVNCFSLFFPYQSISWWGTLENITFGNLKESWKLSELMVTISYMLFLLVIAIEDLVAVKKKKSASCMLWSHFTSPKQNERWFSLVGKLLYCVRWGFSREISSSFGIHVHLFSQINTNSRHLLRQGRQSAISLNVCIGALMRDINIYRGNKSPMTCDNRHMMDSNSSWNRLGGMDKTHTSESIHLSPWCFQQELGGL